MRQREGQALLEELLDVRALDVFGLLDLNNAKDLMEEVSTFHRQDPIKHLDCHGGRTWIDLKRARWRAAMSE